MPRNQVLIAVRSEEISYRKLMKMATIVSENVNIGNLRAISSQNSPIIADIPVPVAGTIVQIANKNHRLIVLRKLNLT